MVIELDSVTKIYDQGQPNQVVALKGVNLRVEKGEMVCIKGPSGSGKTTLLSIIGCIFSPTSGRATIGSKKVSRMPDHFLTRYRRELIGFVFQSGNMIEQLSVLDNIGVPLIPLGISPRERRRKGERLLEIFQLGHRKNFSISQLSGGELQRVAVARALVNDPPIIIADEPTAHLDRTMSLEVVELLASLVDEGRTVIVASHDTVVFDHPRMTRIVIVRDGDVKETLPAD